MNRRPIMDAGPGINFFSLNKERLLFATVGAVSVPETVHDEIRRKAQQEQRFATALRVINKLPERLFEVLSDDATPELSVVVNRMTQLPMSQRRQNRKDLGEIMVIAHAVVAAETGENVTVLIDDQWGRTTATYEANHLLRLQQAGRPVGRLNIITTLTVLKNAAGKEYIPDRRTMRDLYTKMRRLDDGLIPLEDTNLLGLACWQNSR